MAHIKCRYAYPVCRYWYPSKKRIYHDTYWFCDGDGYCPDDGSKYTRPDGQTTVINPVCKHCDYVVGEFEKNVRSYSYEDGWLRVGKTKYADNEILYLEIDGRTLVEQEDGAWRVKDTAVRIPHHRN